MPLDIDQDRAKLKVRRGAYAHLFSEYEMDEKAVARYWESLGRSVERLDMEEKRNPDFLLSFANGARALCEVKSFGGPDTGVSDYSLDYPSDLRISNALYTGIEQLRTYPHEATHFGFSFS